MQEKCWSRFGCCAPFAVPVHRLPHFRSKKSNSGDKTNSRKINGRINEILAIGKNRENLFLSFQHLEFFYPYQKENSNNFYFWWRRKKRLSGVITGHIEKVLEPVSFGALFHRKNERKLPEAAFPLCSNDPFLRFDNIILFLTLSLPYIGSN